MDQNFNYVCRVCLTKNPSTEMWSLAADRTRTLLFECTSVLVLPGDDYPQHLCTKCWNHCRVWNEFKLLAMETDRQIKEPGGSEGLSLKDQKDENIWEEFPDGTEDILSRSKTKDNSTDDNEDDEDEVDGDVFRNMDEEMASESQETVFQCEVCGKDLASRSNLARHMLVHVGEFKCNLCPNAYEDQGQLSRHIQLKHNTRCTLNDDEKQFICNFCKKTFSKKNYLRAHILVHTARRFKCEAKDCGSTFKLKHHLHQHLESHERKKLKAASKIKTSIKTETG